MVLERDDVIAARSIDEVDERGCQRRFTARARPGDQDEAFRLRAQSLDLFRQAKLLGRNGARRNHAEDPAGATVIAERHAADAADVGHVANPFGTCLTSQRFAVALGDDVEDQRLDVRLGKYRFAVDRADLAVNTDRRVRLRSEI